MISPYDRDLVLPAVLSNVFIRFQHELFNDPSGRRLVSSLDICDVVLSIVVELCLREVEFYRTPAFSFSFQNFCDRSKQV